MSGAKRAPFHAGTLPAVDSTAMGIDWDDPNWGGRVHKAEKGYDLSKPEQEGDDD